MPNGWLAMPGGHNEFEGILRVALHPASAVESFVANSVIAAFPFERAHGLGEVIDNAADLQVLGATDVRREPLHKIGPQLLRARHVGTYPHGVLLLRCTVDYYLTGVCLLQHTMTATLEQVPSLESDFTAMTRIYDDVLAREVIS